MICSRYFGGGICRCTSRLDGLVVIITGGNSGIGRALALQLVNKGRTTTVYLSIEILVVVIVYCFISTYLLYFIKSHFVTSRFNSGNSKIKLMAAKIHAHFYRNFCRKGCTIRYV